MIVLVLQLFVLLYSVPCSIGTAISQNTGHLVTPIQASITTIGGATVPKSKVIAVKDEAQFNKIVKQAHNKVVVVDFTTTWCMPCKMISPVYDRLSINPQFSQIVFTKVDVDAVPEVAQRFQVRSMPSFLFIKDGKVIDRFSGADQARLLQLLKEHS